MKTMMTKMHKINPCLWAVLWAWVMGLAVACAPKEKEQNNAQNVQAPAGKAKAIRYLALGDSYTIGEDVEESMRYPNLLHDVFFGFGVSIQTQIIAKTGWTTSELQQAINEAAPEKNFDLVSLLIGVNNQYRGLPLTEYTQEFRLLLEQAIAFANGKKQHVFVLSIPDYSVTPFAKAEKAAQISKEISDFNRAAQKICDSMQVKFVDITQISLQAKQDPTLLASDKLHPSGKMYRRWAMILQTAICAQTDLCK